MKINMTVEQVEGRVPVTILELEGELDGSNYETVIDKAKTLCDTGAKDILLDMSKVTFMASSGVVALHSIALLMRGEKLPDPEFGWDALHAIDRDRNAGVQEHIKILNPQPAVNRTLEVTGLKEQFFEVFTDRETAIASF
jgi:anti-anti-sigma factor